MIISMQVQGRSDGDGFDPTSRSRSHEQIPFFSLVIII